MLELAQDFELFESSTPWIAASVVFGAGLVAAIAIAALVNLVARRLLQDQREAGRVAGATFWVVTVISVLVALGRLAGPRTTQQGLTDATQRFLVRLPDLLIALVVLVLAWIVAVALRGILRRVLARFQPAAADILAPVGFWAVLVLAVLIAADQVGIELRSVEITLLVLLGGLVLAASLALGLGSRDLVAGVVAGRHVARIVAVGDEIEVDRIRGTVTTLGHASVLVAGSDGEVEIPNHVLLHEAVTIVRRGAR